MLSGAFFLCLIQQNCLCLLIACLDLQNLTLDAGHKLKLVCCGSRGVSH